MEEKMKKLPLLMCLFVCFLSLHLIAQQPGDVNNDEVINIVSMPSSWPNSMWDQARLHFIVKQQMSTVTALSTSWMLFLWPSFMLAS
jgi:hypothetical protein